MAKNFDICYLIYIEKIFLSKDEITLFSGILVKIKNNEINFKQSNFNQAWLNKLEFIEISKKGYEEVINKFINTKFFISNINKDIEISQDHNLLPICKAPECFFTPSDAIFPKESE